jgi:putative ABC transport system ATP-binding protein
MSEIAIKIQNIFKSFQVGQQNVPILKGISFDVQKGDFLVIFGPSGCGKSTLLHTILGLEEPSDGSITMLEVDLYKQGDEDVRSNFRKNHIGMVYQQPNWVKSLNVIENIAFPLQLLGMEKIQGLKKAEDMLRVVGMSDWSEYVPTELSSGQQQKIALARSIITDPEIIIADEPTGNLDFESGQELMQLLMDLNKNKKKTIVMVTHDLEYLTFASKVIHIFDGKLSGQYGQKDKQKLLSSLRLKKRDPFSTVKVKEIKKKKEKK